MHACKELKRKTKEYQPHMQNFENKMNITFIYIYIHIYIGLSGYIWLFNNQAYSAAYMDIII